jgi:bacteriocin biosynthesis cyclodehydratase domain-containing protein
VKPLLPKHYSVRVEPSEDDGGEETLVFTSERKRVVISGRSFHAFLEHVVPLLDGQHLLEDIKRRVAGIFDPQDIEDSLSLLARHHILADAEREAFPPELGERLEPQLAYLREVSPDPAQVIERLAEARVTVVGLGAVGTVAATALAAAKVGRVRCVDGSAVSPADPFLAQIFSLDDVGRGRADVTCTRITMVNPTTLVEPLADELQTDEDVATAIEGSDFVLGCLDPGLTSITYRLNRACLTQGVPWSVGSATAFEGIVGPTVIPHETACYLCYQMRTVACADDPGDALSELKRQDSSRTDASRYRENLPFGSGIVGQLLALEAFKALIGLRPPTAGRILTVDFFGSAMKQHVVLRKPRCPACFPSGGA